MRLRTTISRLVFATLLIPIAGCGRKPEPKPEESRPERAGESAQATPAEPAIPLAEVTGVKFEKVAPPSESESWLPGEAIAAENDEVQISAPAAGIVMRIEARPGQAVRAGAPLLRIRSPELADLQGRWMAARAERRRAEADYERERRMAQAGATASRDLDAARAQAESTLAAEQAARLALTGRGFTGRESGGLYLLRAPGEGAIRDWSVKAGEGVAAGQPLGRFLAAEAGVVKMECPAPGPDWRVGELIAVRAPDGRRFKARVATIAPPLDPQSRRRAYRLDLAGTGPLLPGEVVEVRVPLGKGALLPESALQQIDGRWGVFVKRGDAAVFTPVTRGGAAGGRVLVASGPDPGAEVATEGAYLLKTRWLKTQGGGDEHD